MSWLYIIFAIACIILIAHLVPLWVAARRNCQSCSRTTAEHGHSYWYWCAEHGQTNDKRASRRDNCPDYYTLQGFYKRCV